MLRRALAACLLFGVGGAPASAAAQERFEFEEAHMGTAFRIVIHAPDGSAARAGATAAFAVVARLDSLLSDYRPDSELSLLSRASGGEPRPVSPEVGAVLALARSWAERSDGAFDPTVGPLSRLWRWSSRRGALPDSARLAAARAAVGWEALSLDPAAGTARLERPGMALDLGGIAKGFAADAALATLRSRGLGAALVDAGGDLALGDAPPDSPPDSPGWRIVLPDGRVARLAGVGVATSGDAHRFVEIEGVRRSHVLDPRTGLGVIDAPTVTVIAPDAATADVLASALTVMTPEAGRALLGRTAGASAWVSGSTGWESESFARPGGRAHSGARE